MGRREQVIGPSGDPAVEQMDRAVGVARRELRVVGNHHERLPGAVELEQQLADARAKGSCLLCLGWGGGLTTKSAWLDATNPEYRQILDQYQIYSRALATNLPFPKTRKIVFLNNRPATLPGWAELSVEE